MLKGYCSLSYKANGIEGVGTSVGLGDAVGEGVGVTVGILVGVGVFVGVSVGVGVLVAVGTWAVWVEKISPAILVAVASISAWEGPQATRKANDRKLTKKI